MPDYIKIAQTAAEMWCFWIFQNGGRRCLGFLKFYIIKGFDNNNNNSYLMVIYFVLVGFKNNSNNNKQICMAPLGRNFRGAGTVGGL